MVISTIVPARNEEATIARVVESLATQPEVAEIIAVDDNSSDSTGRILAELAQRTPKLRVLTAGPLPPGWAGKNHAAWIGAQAARGDWLLFTDADTRHEPGAARRALADAAERGAALVSYSPEQELGSLGERALVPFVYCRLAARFSYARVNDPALPDAAANGQFILVSREAYERVGGHATVAGELLEDLALARRMKQSGQRIYFSAERGLVWTRMYRSFGAMWEGWTRNLYTLVGGTPRAVWRELRAVVPWPEALLVLACAIYAVHDQAGLGWWAIAGPVLVAIVAVAARTARYGAQLRRNLFPVSLIQYYGAGVALYAAALAVSWRKNTRGSVMWKGRAYAANAPGADQAGSRAPAEEKR